MPICYFLCNQDLGNCHVLPWLQWLVRLKCRATGLDTSLSFLPRLQREYFEELQVNSFGRLTSQINVFFTFSPFWRTNVERSYARTTGFASQVLQTKDIVVFVSRDLRVIIVKRVSLLMLTFKIV